jgi:hypothetical protein
MDPPAGDRYLQLGANGTPRAVNGLQPFATQVTREQLPRELRLSRAEELKLENDAQDLDVLAFAIDQALNNTSIVALFSFGSQHLLFPGDAQFGNWDSWLGQPDAADILSSLTFFKIAHHGSVNATPKRVIDGLTPNQTAAMVSTQVKPWPSIPRGPMLDALNKKTGGRWVRSDTIQLPDAPNQPAGPVPKGFTRQSIWYDYTF